MKKILKLIATTIILVLSSCNFTRENPSFDVNRPQSTISYDFSEKPNEMYNGYYKANSIKYKIKDADDQIGWHSLNSVGNQSILVVPVQFRDGRKWTEPMLKNLYSAFFGESNETNWESVHSFFYKSSYGQLNITGEIYSSPITINKYTVKGFDNSYYLGLDDPSKIITTTFYNQASNDLLQKYDQDNDGFVDAVVFCYSNSYSDDSDSAYWAWVDYTSNRSIPSKPNINTFMWISYEFIHEKYLGIINTPQGLDAHTFIHESGHLLGLDDYYNYDFDWEPAGALDMQSYNLGDHNIYSKLALGWVKPYVVTDSTSITIRSSAKYGDAILIKDTWNGSIFDEYLLLEYYTPEELNKQDSIYTFSNRNKMYNYSGIRLYHVDARLVSNIKSKYNENGKIVRSHSGYTSDFDSTTCYIGAANSPLSWSYLNKTDAMSYYYLHLLDSGNHNILNEGNLITNETLWTKGQTFNCSNSTGFFKNETKFNDFSNINYIINIQEMNDETATIRFIKN